MTARWRVKLRCERDLFARFVVESESRKDAVELAKDLARRQGYVVLGMLGDVERVWPTQLEDDRGPDDRDDKGTYAGRGTEVPH